MGKATEYPPFWGWLPPIDLSEGNNDDKALKWRSLLGRAKRARRYLQALAGGAPSATQGPRIPPSPRV